MAYGRHMVLAAMMGLAATSASASDKSTPPAAGESKPDPKREAEDKLLSQSWALIFQGKPGDALPLLNSVIAGHDAQAAKEPRALYSARTIEESLHYLIVGGVGPGKDAVVMPYSWGFALFTKGYALIDLRRSDEAKTYLDRAAAISPGNARFLGELAEWHKAHGQLVEARRIFTLARDAAQFSPDEFKNREKARALRGIGWVDAEERKFDDAEAMFRESLTLEPGNAMATNELTYIAQQRAKAMR